MQLNREIWEGAANAVVKTAGEMETEIDEKLRTGQCSQEEADAVLKLVQCMTYAAAAALYVAMVNPEMQFVIVDQQEGGDGRENRADDQGPGEAAGDPGGA